MKDVRISDQTSNISLGRAGEKEVRRLIMDVSAWEMEFPGGSLSLFVDRPDGEGYNAPVEQQGSAWVHTVTIADTEVAGRGCLQMQWMMDQHVLRSRIIDAVVLPSIERLGKPPDPPEQGYLEQMAAIGAQAMKDAQAAAASAEASGQSATWAQSSEEAAADSAEVAERSATQAQNGAQAASDSAMVAEQNKEQAEQSATQAQNSAGLAETSAKSAADSAGDAEQRAAQAQSSAEAAEQSATQAQNSAESAEQSVVLAQSVAEAAEQSKDQAAQSATQAQSSAQVAQATADKLSGLGAEAETLPSGSEATVTLEENRIIYGIPRGDKGEPGKDGVRINDVAINLSEAWSSKKIIDTLCPAFTESGNPVVCYPVEGYPLGVTASWEPRQEGDGEPSPDNVRAITGRDSVQIFQNDKLSCALDLKSVIYGGQVEASTGDILKKYYEFELNGSEDWKLSSAGSSGLKYFEATLVSNAALLPSSGGNISLAKASQLSSHLKIGNPYSENVDNAGWIYTAGGYTNINARVRISAYDGSLAGFKSYLAAQKEAGTPVTIVYKLASANPASATGGTSIPALAGTNTISTDADNLTVTGRTDPIHTIQMLSDRVAALENAAITNNNGGMQS